jgi:hypothetical protein
MNYTLATKKKFKRPREKLKGVTEGFFNRKVAYQQSSENSYISYWVHVCGCGRGGVGCCLGVDRRQYLITCKDQRQKKAWWVEMETCAVKAQGTEGQRRNY